MAVQASPPQQSGISMHRLKPFLFFSSRPGILFRLQRGGEQPRKKHALGDCDAVRNKARTALRILILFTFPAAVGMYLLGTPVSQVLYGMKAAGPVVSALAPSVFFLGLHQVTAAILHLCRFWFHHA